MASKPPGDPHRGTKSATAGATQVKPAEIQQQAAARQQKAPSRLKLLIRRLPPCLTKDEFQAILGDEWRVGTGRVDRLDYHGGKIRSPGKLPEQSRAYLSLANPNHISFLEAKFLNVTFHDAKASYAHPDLKQWLPLLEYAPCQRLPPSKPRLDNRQGLIDQDPEYMAFLEGETQAQPKAAALDAASIDRTKEVVTTTPLIEALRERKAVKAKAAAAKIAAKKDREEAEVTDKAAKSVTPKAKKEAAGSTKTSAKPAVEGKKVLKPSTKTDIPGKNKDSSIASATTVSPTDARKRERAPASIRSLLERDLGISKPARRAPKDDTGTAQPSKIANPADNKDAGTRVGRVPSARVARAGPDTIASSSTPVPKPSTATTSTPKTTPQNTADASRPNPNSKVSGPVPDSAVAVKGRRSTTKPSPGAKKAYIKHANPSQGITEALLRQALGEIGALTSLEVDKRKGTALAEFSSPDALVNAVAKRTIPIAQGAVEIIEFREKPAAASAMHAASRGPHGNGPVSSASQDRKAPRAGAAGQPKGRVGGGGGGGGRNSSSSTSNIAAVAPSAAPTSSTTTAKPG